MYVINMYSVWNMPVPKNDMYVPLRAYMYMYIYIYIYKIIYIYINLCIFIVYLYVRIYISIVEQNLLIFVENPSPLSPECIALVSRNTFASSLGFGGLGGIRIP